MVRMARRREVETQSTAPAQRLDDGLLERGVRNGDDRHLGPGAMEGAEG